MKGWKEHDKNNFAIILEREGVKDKLSNGENRVRMIEIEIERERQGVLRHHHHHFHHRHSRHLLIANIYE